MPTTWRLVALAGALLLGACQSAPIQPRPITIARDAFAGEALYRGTLEIRDGCIVSSRRNFPVLFDPGVVLTANSDGLYEPRTGNTIRFGQEMQGGGGILRENGKGWPILDIERFYEVSIPSGCPMDNVMRLHAMKEVAE
ncbi:hypothetical protein GCM10023208_15580 [Erythrobacter westpacificensis]|uniref:Lipoprotein n=1 Tax=Erythrobacter westpacificensis TaxID=1055231 RepID=A0ABP9KBM2_9SPHN